jgi:threonine dehydrogenase-like Zn-dependent dehydrogenase
MELLPIGGHEIAADGAEVGPSRPDLGDPMSTKNPCRRCQERCAQGGTGLCRRCQRETGDTKTNKERERERIERHRPKLFVPAADLKPRPSRTVVIGGVEYEVTFDGS